MSNIRDLQNPSGADVEAFVNQQLASLQRGLVGKMADGSATFKAQDYDIRCEMAHMYPGKEWEYVGITVIGVNVVVVWRMSRVRQAELGLEPIMKLTSAGNKPA